MSDDLKEVMDNVEENEIEIIPEIPPAEIHLNVTTDKMLVYLKVTTFDESQIVTAQEVLDKLAQMKVNYGIKEKELNEYCEKRTFYKEIKVAAGTRVINGKDGELVNKFEKVVSRTPKLRDDGTLDFKNIDIIQNVNKNQLLSYVIPATEGTDGTDVFSNTIKAKPGKNPSLPQGKNTVANQEKTELYAAVDGAIEYDHKMQKVNIEENYVISNNVGPETGNISVNGNIIVNGNVLEGFTVTAKKNITVKGLVEGATLFAGENILISSGFNGMSKGLLHAQGDVTVKFIENGTVFCGGSVRTEVAMISNIKAGKNIIAKGYKTSLVAGTYQAGNAILASNIGTANNNNIQLIIKSNWFEEEKQALENVKVASKEKKASKKDLIAEKENCIGILDTIADQVNTLNKLDRNDENFAKKPLLLKKLILKKTEWIQKLNDLNKELAEFNEYEKQNDVRIICSGTIHLGSKITLNSTTLKLVDDITNQKFFLNEGEIEIGPILPGEKDFK